MPTSLSAIILAISSSIIGAFGGFLFNRASKNLAPNFSALLKNYRLIAGFVLFFLAAAIYIIALRNGELNILYPISSLTYVWSTLLAKSYLNENINIYKWTGIILILIGAILIVR